MLSTIEIREIGAVLVHSPSKQSAAPEALKIVQHYRGWISDSTLEDIAAYLGISGAELDEIATFYNRIYRSPVGKHVILLCDSVSCWIMDGVTVRDHLLKMLGLSSECETTADGIFTVLPAACLGACDHAPAMMIDNELFGNLTIEKINDILDRYRNGAADERFVNIQNPEITAH